MYKDLQIDEIEQLKQFRFSTKERLSDLSFPLNQVSDDSALLQYLEKVGAHIGSPNSKVTASIFVKRYAFIAVIYLYGISAWNKKLDPSLTNISLQTVTADDLWLPTFYFHEVKMEEAEGSRDQWRENAVKELFSNNIHVLIEQVSKVTKQSKQILWENIAIYLFWLYETVLPKIEDEEIQTRAEEDFHYLISEAPGFVFGNEPTNPIKRHYNKKVYIEDLQEEVRVRTTCCVSYLLQGTSKCCKTCPKNQLNNFKCT
jgi:ferric iron reductase protein FhuF